MDSKENTNPNPQRITSSEAQLAELMTSIELEKKTIELHELKLRKAQLFNVNISDRESATSSQEGDSTWGYYNGRNNLTESYLAQNHENFPHFFDAGFSGNKLVALELLALES